MKNFIVLLTILFIVLFFVLLGQLYAEEITYTYDALNRITQVEYSNGTIISYIYDEIGNRLVKSVSKPTAEIASSPMLVAELPSQEIKDALTPISTKTYSEKMLLKCP